MTKRIVLLQALASTPGDIRRLVRPLDEDAGHWQPDLAHWSARDVLRHLIHVERAYQARIDLILSQREPRVPFIHPDRIANEVDVPLTDLSEQFAAAREETMGVLQALGQGEWQRTAIHETRGRTTLRYLIQDLVDHDIEHTNQLVEIGMARRTAERNAAAPVERAE